ncbi:MAG: radical SAM protein [Myxococcales bacterium]|nr:radical SAM protein [Myxococcales bacterium]
MQIPILERLFSSSLAQQLGPAFQRNARGVRLVAGGIVDKYHPLLVQIIPMRRCNLACTYCNEYDRTSDPVPLAMMLRRIDRLAELRSACVTISGGEPLLHPELDQILRRIRDHGMIAGLITNGFLLGKERIERLNDAGLEYLQISIDNVNPDKVSQKSLKTLNRKLSHLAEYARFHVNINSVVGSGMANPQDPVVIAKRAKELGFSTSVGVLHDEQGQLSPLSAEESAVFHEVVRIGQGIYTRINNFQENLIAGQPNDWHCRAGARYLYVCENGLVHYCSQQRGKPGTPLETYSQEDIRREFDSVKDCASLCTIGCVHRASALDELRPSRLLQIWSKGKSVSPSRSQVGSDGLRFGS